MKTIAPKSLDPQQRAELLVRRMAGLVASLLVGPGAGQLAMGYRLRALIWFGVGGLTVLPGPLFSVWAFYLNLPLRAASGLETLLLRPPERGMPRWPAVVGFWAGLMALSFGLRAASSRVYHVVAASNAAMAPAVAPGEQVIVVSSGYEPGRGDAVAIVEPEHQRLRLTRIIAMKGDRVAVSPDGRITINGRMLSQTALPGSCEYLQHGPTPRGPVGTDEPPPAPQVKPCRLVAERHGALVRKVILAPRGSKGRPSSRSASQPSSRSASGSPAVGRSRIYTVPAGKVFVWGDNRVEAPGSQKLGLIPVANIVGQLREIWYSAGQDGSHWARVGAAVQ